MYNSFRKFIFLGEKMFKKFMGFVILISITVLNTNCHDNDNSKFPYKNATLLLAYEYQRLSSSLLPIQGYYDTGYYSSGTFTSNTPKLVVSASTSGIGTWAEAEPTTGGTYGKCNNGATVTGNGTSGGSDKFYRIISYTSSTNTLILQTSTSCDFNGFSDTRATYSKIIFTSLTTSGCESSATSCFSYCEIAYGKTSVALAQNDTTVANSSLLTTTGCGGSSWSRALTRSNTTTWN